MKTKALMIALLAFFFLASCSEKDEITNPKPAVKLLNHVKTEYLGCFIDPPTRDHFTSKRFYIL